MGAWAPDAPGPKFRCLALASPTLRPNRSQTQPQSYFNKPGSWGVHTASQCWMAALLILQKFFDPVQWKRRFRELN